MDMEMEKVVAPAQPVDLTTSSLDRQSEKTHASGSIYDELNLSNGEATDIREETVPEEAPREELDGRKKAIIVLALCVSFAFFYYDHRWNWLGG